MTIPIYMWTFIYIYILSVSSPRQTFLFRPPLAMCVYTSHFAGVDEMKPRCPDHWPYIVVPEIFPYIPYAINGERPEQFIRVVWTQCMTAMKFRPHNGHEVGRRPECILYSWRRNREEKMTFGNVLNSRARGTRTRYPGTAYKDEKIASAFDFISKVNRFFFLSFQIFGTDSIRGQDRAKYRSTLKTVISSQMAVTLITSIFN